MQTKEVLRQWIGGAGNKRIAARVGLDVKTVRRYVNAATELGLRREQGEAALTDELITQLLSSLQGRPGRQHGEAWARCEEQREFIAQRLVQGLKLTKVRKLLQRQGVSVPYPTLHRFAVAELGFGQTATTIPVADCGPAEELQVDTGWMTYLEPNALGQRRRFRAWIFTSVFSRHRFVWPCLQETTVSAIEACEAAWQFYGGVFRVLLPDNTKAIVTKADPLDPLINETFLEYAQARGFVIDPARVRQPRDKGRVERAVQSTRDDCFAGETLNSILDARELAERWCKDDYGMRRHTSTQRLPLECFDAKEKPRLLPPPALPYEVPIWSDPKVGRDQLAQVCKALYWLPTHLVGKTLKARADRTLVRFYYQGALMKTHTRMPPGGRSIDPSDYPAHKSAYAMRDVEFLKRQAFEHGPAIGRFAEALLDVPLPWTRMRRVYTLLGLVRRYGAARVDEMCVVALEAQMHDVRRLERMVEAAATPPETAIHTAPNPVTPARYLRPASDFAMPLPFTTSNDQ